MPAPHALAVISGGLSSQSTTLKLATLLANETLGVAARSGVPMKLNVIRLSDLAADLGQAFSTGEITEALAHALHTAEQADALIVATPTYKAGYAGMFKAFMDQITDGTLAGVPTVVAATGGSPRHSLMVDTQLRSLFGYFRTLVMPTSIFAAPGDWDSEELEPRAHQAAEELIRHLAPTPRADGPHAHCPPPVLARGAQAGASAEPGGPTSDSASSQR